MANPEMENHVPQPPPVTCPACEALETATQLADNGARIEYLVTWALQGCVHSSSSCFNSGISRACRGHLDPQSFEQLKYSVRQALGAALRIPKEPK